MKLERAMLCFLSTFPCSVDLRGQRKVWDPTELELQDIVRHHVGARTQPVSSTKAAVLLPTEPSLNAQNVLLFKNKVLMTKQPPHPNQLGHWLPQCPLSTHQTHSNIIF